MISHTRVAVGTGHARVHQENVSTRTMVPPGGTAHIADGADPAESEVMRVRRSPGARQAGAARIPRTARSLLAWLPGLAAVLGLILCADGIGHTGAGRRPPVAARPAALHPATKPHIVPRSAWLDSLTRHAQPPPRYDDKVVAVFVHHTDSPNGYDCADVPRIIRYLYAGQTGARNWDDIGYNFLVDRCGTIYEGRAGASTAPSPAPTRRVSTTARPASPRSAPSRPAPPCRRR